MAEITLSKSADENSILPVRMICVVNIADIIPKAGARMEDKCC